ncbi:DUF1294 domain-containing protein [Porcipelethomonas sp.]|uniref:DUF1294 domain-containing protein n=1 Tax=Porcipelethomonas sp. TaxID=2981675 RepID=UPI003EF1061C
MLQTASEFISRCFLVIPVLLIIYFIIINIISLIIFYIDKQRAIKHQWRIPEATLLTVAFIGGSFGAYAGMKLFRHKTKHAKFYISVPLFMLLHIIIIVMGIYGITLI